MSSRKLLPYENAKSKQPPPYKKTDFRLQLWKNERKDLKTKIRRENFRVVKGDRVKNAPVSVDTTKARSNSDVVRLCLHDLGWNENDGTSKRKSHIYWYIEIILWPCMSVFFEDNSFSLFQAQLKL